MVLNQKINNEIVSRETKNIEFSEHFDLVVAGLGTAGSIAAIKASKLGLRVLAIDRLNCMGGMSTAGGIMGYYFGSSGGFYEELDSIREGYMNDIYINKGESKKFVLESEAVKYGAVILYETTVTGVYLYKNNVKGVQIFTPKGILNISLDVILDCTGEAEICTLIGCQFLYGRESDGKTQPFTSVKVYLSQNKVYITNFDSGCVNQTDDRELTNAIINSHSGQLNDRLCEADNRILYLAPLLGIREGRRIIGEKTVTADMVLSGKAIEQPVFYAYADFDKHGRDNAYESEIMQEWYVACNLGAVNVSVPIPLGCMIPKGFGKILAVGRSISVDHDVQSCVRMVRDMQKEGEIAAVAAYLSIKNKYAFNELPYCDILPYLKESGCLDEKNNIGFCFDSAGNKNREKIVWLTDENKIKLGLSSEKPGISLWSVKLQGKKLVPFLKEWLASENVTLRRNSAIALGLLNESDGLAVIREMIKERDAQIFHDCRKNNQIRMYIAIYMAGKLCDSEIIDELIYIACDKNEYNNPIYRDKMLCTTSDKLEHFRNLYYQNVSFSVAALIKLGNKFENQRFKIAKAFNKAFSDNEYIKRITDKECSGYEYSIAENISIIVKAVCDKWKNGI